MKGETALGIITVTAFVFILVFMIAAGGVGGGAETLPPVAAEAPVAAPAATTAPTPEPSPEPTTALPTPEPAPADPVEGRWVQGPSAGHLLLTAGGTGEMVAGEEASSITWTYDPAVRVGSLRAYRLAAPCGGEYMLYLDRAGGTLTMNGQGVALTYARAP